MKDTGKTAARAGIGKRGMGGMRRRMLAAAYYAVVGLIIVSPFLMIGLSVLMLLQMDPPKG